MKEFSFYGFDQMGHGYSEGPRMLINNENSLFDDAYDFINLIFEKENLPNDLPFFL